MCPGISWGVLPTNFASVRKEEHKSRRRCRASVLSASMAVIMASTVIKLGSANGFLFIGSSLLGTLLDMRGHY